PVALVLLPGAGHGSHAGRSEASPVALRVRPTCSATPPSLDHQKLPPPTGAPGGSGRGQRSLWLTVFAGAYILTPSILRRELAQRSKAWHDIGPCERQFVIG